MTSKLSFVEYGKLAIRKYVDIPFLSLSLFNIKRMWFAEHCIEKHMIDLFTVKHQLFEFSLVLFHFVCLNTLSNFQLNGLWCHATLAFIHRPTVYIQDR